MFEWIGNEMDEDDAVYKVPVRAEWIEREAQRLMVERRARWLKRGLVLALLVVTAALAVAVLAAQ